MLQKYLNQIDSNARTEEKAFITNNGGNEILQKILSDLINLHNEYELIDYFEKSGNSKKSAIAAIIFFSTDINKLYGYKCLPEIAKTHSIAAKALFNRQEPTKNFLKNDYSFLVGVLKSHIETASFFFDNTEKSDIFFKAISENIGFALCEIAKASFEHSKLILGRFPEKLEDQHLSEIAQVNTEAAKIILLNEDFLNRLSTPDEYGKTTDLQIVASSNQGTAKWIFTVANHNIVKRFTEEDFKSMFENNGEYDVAGKTMKAIYNDYCRDKDFIEIRKVARILGQGNRSGTSLFSSLPNELVAKIAALTIDTQILSENESQEVASTFLGKPNP